MQINKLELKNITYYKQGSEETPCYNAVVYVNGKKLIHVGNDGHGGCDRQDGIGEYNYKHVEEVNKWCIKTFGQGSFTYKSNGKEEVCTYDIDLEHWCHDRLYEFLDKKILKKELQKKYLCVMQDDYKDERFLVSWKRRGKDFDESFQKYLVAKEPDLVGKCLNFLPFDKAWKIYEEVTS